MQGKPVQYLLKLVLVCIGLLCVHSPKDAFAFTGTYTIHADLVPELRHMTYTETVEISNAENVSTNILYFHIYGNKFKGLRQVKDGDIKVLSVRDQNGNALKCQRSQKGVLYCVRLAKSLRPGQSVKLIFLCEVIIPDLERMYGISKDGDVQLPMFSLQLAIYDQNGWDIAPLQKNGDGRFGAAADYTFEISIPQEYILTCNGNKISRKTNNGISTYVFEAEKRRDIIIFACKDYVCLEREVGNTVIWGYFNKTVENVTQQAMEYVMDWAAFSLDYYNGIFCEYPYDTLVVTNSALGTNLALSEEYSGLFTILFTPDYSNMKSTIFHEVAHQWFYGLIGNNENLEAWLDEGFAEFAAGLCLDACGDTETGYWELITIMSNAVAEEKVNIPCDEASNYQWVIYERSAAFLKDLMDTIGQEDFLGIISDYCQKYRYGVTTTKDFIKVLQEKTDANISGIVAEYIAS